MKDVELLDITEESMLKIAEGFSDISRKYSLNIETCAEKIDLSNLGINHSKCIDGKLIEKIINCDIEVTQKDRYKLDGNREACGCIKCIDIGEYDTCMHNCAYCYANLNKQNVLKKYNEHDKNSPILIGNIDDNIIIKERNIKDTKSFKVKKYSNKIIYQQSFL